MHGNNILFRKTAIVSRKRPLVLVSSPLFERDRILAQLQESGVRVHTLPEHLNSPEHKQLLAEAQAAIISPECVFPESYVHLSPNLRIVVSPVIGIEHIAVDALTDRGVPVAHGADPVNFAGMAESVVGLIVALMHRFGGKEQELRRGVPRSGPPGTLLRGRTVGVVGGGRIGKAVLQRLQGWECELLVADPKLQAAQAQQFNAELVELPNLLSSADVITLQLPLNAHTRNLIDAQEFSIMKPGAYLVNVSRGSVVNESALLNALTSGTLAGAAVDVWEQEPPPPDHPLLAVEDRLIATPHNVGHTLDAYIQLAELATKQTLAGLRGEPLDYIANSQVL